MKFCHETRFRFNQIIMNKYELIEKKSQTGFLYAYEVCLMASNEDLQMIFDNISGCIRLVNNMV